MLRRFYRIVWLLLELLVSLYETLRWLFLCLHATALWSYDRYSGSETTAQRDRVILDRCKSALTKMPRHVALIVGPQATHINEAVLSRLFNYAYELDIGCVSVYYAGGKEGRVRWERLGVPKGVCCSEVRQNHWLWTSETQPVLPTANGKAKVATSNGALANGGLQNGSTGCGSVRKSLQICELSAADGRPLIADICRLLHSQRHDAEVQALCSNRNQLIERINAELTERLHQMFDPELALVFNAHTCTFGLLPWHTRFTEFYTHETGRSIDAAMFAQMLYKYSRVEQRRGK